MNWNPFKSHEPPRVRAAFMPQKDITAYELAVIISNLGPIMRPPKRGVDFTPDLWGNFTGAGLDPSLKRHFKVI